MNQIRQEPDMPEALYAPLPKPSVFAWADVSEKFLREHHYTADQMRAYADDTCSLRGGQQGWRPVPEWVYDLVLSGNLEPVLMRAGDEATRLRLYRARQEMLAALPTSTHPQETER